MAGPVRKAPGAEDLAYIDTLHGSLPPALAELEAHGRRDGIPIVARAAGRVLAVLAARRRRILEIGTAYGYSTLWMALSMDPDGLLTTIDPDRARTDVARGYWRAAGVPDRRIAVVNRHALEALADEVASVDGAAPADRATPTVGDVLAGPFELVFIDALKEEYASYLEAALPRCAPGAVVVADNVLWGGRVAGAPWPGAGDRPASSTEALRAFNRHALSHPRLHATIVPVGDGLLLAVVRR